MLTSSADTVARQRPAYRSFRAVVARALRLTPHFTRITFTGEEFAGFGTAGLDQRVKVVLPLAGRGYADFPDGEDWYQQWRELPADRRNPFRTYTVRAVRPAEREVDIDFALHGDIGPASTWAARAMAGEEIVLIGPDELSPDRAVGIDFRPGAVETVLLAGDETAAPAICAILEQLPATAAGVAIIEVPTTADELSVRAPAGVEVRWLARTADDAVHGERLVPAVRDWVARNCAPAADSAGATVDDLALALEAAERADRDDAPLWDVPEGRSLDGDCYAWIAGEASVITGLRRFLVRDAGLDRRRVAFMGYWRRGRAEVE
ncbi:siderophore-interacting protein [Agromyces sp. CFH 90414]|uniref:Siderophore-interacting protein n=1 Tax=Agromyces agglutinans TaxID=2662258 RepID=A0A6I2FMB2_9MICO|nr:siderophore-interacting protein [Agromyces agglutinans]MRG61738.1 siderophore-interacting protein [Agromyces agglutinans]